MDFPRSRATCPGLIVVDALPSTNDELVRRAAERMLEEFTTVVTLNQTAGRGRLGRVWVAPPGQALAVSVLLRPGSDVGLDRYGWIPLIAGLAMTRAVRSVLPQSSGTDVSLKWPNDVLISGRKVSGLLSELLPGGTDVVVGAGLNLAIPEDSLPVPTATSLLLAGAVGADLADVALAAYLTELQTLWGTYRDVGGDPTASGIRAGVTRECSTLGQFVRVSLPDGTALLGTAEDLDDSGQLRLRTASVAPLQTVAAGDITHLRYE